MYIDTTQTYTTENDLRNIQYIHYILRSNKLTNNFVINSSMSGTYISKKVNSIYDNYLRSFGLLNLKIS